MKNKAAKNKTPYNFEPERNDDFGDRLKDMMGEKTRLAVAKVFNSLGLPMPYTRNDFLEATEGAIVFSSKLGVAIRIEEAGRKGESSSTRINDNPWILQPIASIRAGDAIIEICPGTETTKDKYDVLSVVSGLASMDIDFWDAIGNDDPSDFVYLYNTGNVGVLPVKLPAFPKGIPVVIDRLSVRALSETAASIKIALDEMEVKEDPQKKLYGPLRKAFNAAWPVKSKPADPAKMKEFWQLCQASVKKGVLIAGWDHAENDAEDYKQGAAADSAHHYDRYLSKFKMR